ncbi:MAG: NAD(+)/NADH kinase [Halobacteriaceae archaeon]
MRVGIVAQRENAHAAYLAADIGEALADRDAEVAFDAATAEALEARSADSFEDRDMVVSIGGDGTFLFAARRAGTTPVLGVNLGEVGFLNAVAPGEAVAAVERELERFREEGAVRSTPVPRLRASGGDGDWALAPALNEVAVQGPRRGRGGGTSVEVRVDGELYAASRADGVIVATPTGSTAYNLSEGGPLVRPGTGALVVTPMAPAAPMRPLVTGLDSAVTVRVDDADSALVAADGASHRWLTPPDRVRVARAAEPARVAGPGVEFFRALGKLE